LALLTALVIPSAAFGQSAGDEQYSDPFAGEGQSEPQQPQSEAQQPETPAQPVEEPAAPEASAPAAESVGEGAGTSAESNDPSLPVTGLPALAMLLVGAGMLTAGAVVRRRT
jgi:hypothetical protein